MLVDMAEARGQTPEQTLLDLLACAEAAGDELAGLETPLLSFDEMKRALQRIPESKQLEHGFSPVYAVLTSTVNVQLHVFTCERRERLLAVMGTLVLPGEEQNLARVRPYVLFQFERGCVFMTLDRYEDAITNPQRDRVTYPFPVHAVDVRIVEGAEN